MRKVGAKCLGSPVESTSFYLGLKDGEYGRWLERKVAGCQSPCVSRGSLDFILTVSIKKAMEMSDQGNKVHRVGLRKETRVTCYNN